MDTVKVDIQKLQLLNDRIAQTIEALNQVRLSVHGIQHTAAAAFSPFGYGSGTQSPFATQQAFPQQVFPQQVLPQQAYPQQGYPTPYAPYATPYAQQLAPQFASQFVPGIQHTATPYTTPYTLPFPQQMVPGFQHTTATAQPIATPTPWTMPYTGNGISHTSWDPTWSRMPAQWSNGISHTSWDPSWQSRVAQTLPLWQVPFTSSW